MLQGANTECVRESVCVCVELRKWRSTLSLPTAFFSSFLSGMGTDEKTLINILANRSAAQRLKIALQFKTMYGKDLEKDLKSETSGHFEDLLVSMLYDRPHFDARSLRKAMKGLGTDERALIEVICTRSNQEIHAIKAAYKESTCSCCPTIAVTLCAWLLASFAVLLLSVWCAHPVGKRMSIFRSPHTHTLSLSLLSVSPHRLPATFEA